MRHRTMRIRLLSVLLPVTLFALVLVGLVTASRVRQVVHGQSAERTMMMLEQISRSVQAQIDGYYIRVLRMGMDMHLQERLRAVKRDPNDSRASMELNAALSSYFDYDNSVVGIVFFMDNGRALSYKTVPSPDAATIREQAWYRQFLSSERRFYVLGRSDLLALRPYASYMFSMLYKPMKPYLKNGVETIYLAFQDGTFEGIYQDYEINRGGDIIIVDQNGQIVGTADGVSTFDGFIEQLWSENAFDQYAGYLERDGYAVSYHQCPQIGWTIIHMLQADIIGADIKATIMWIVAVIAAVFVLMEAVIYVLVKRATHPLEALTAYALSSLAGGNPIPSADTRVTECIALSGSLNEMTERLGDMLHHVEQIEQEKARLELAALQYQISPHFILNTVSAIRTVALEEGYNQRLDDALRAFSGLLGSCLSDVSSMHTLSDEKAYLQSYLDIMCIRYQKRIVASIDFPDAIMGAYVLKFLIQPIIENSYTHGFSGGVQSGRIDIRARVKDDTLQIVVSDDGCGMRAQIDQALASVQNEARGRFSRIGLGNISRRIQIHYPDARFGISIRAQGQGTIIELMLPLRFRLDEAPVSSQSAIEE